MTESLQTHFIHLLLKNLNRNIDEVLLSMKIIGYIENA